MGLVLLELRISNCEFGLLGMAYPGFNHKSQKSHPKEWLKYYEEQSQFQTINSQFPKLMMVVMGSMCILQLEEFFFSYLLFFNKELRLQEGE